MESEDNAEVPVDLARDRRSQPRFEAYGAASLLVSPKRILECRLTDLSLQGCRLRAVERFNAERGLRVQVAFRVHGLGFKFAGIIEWSNRWNQVGIRFIEVPRRCRADLAELIGELKEEGAPMAGNPFAEPADAELQVRSHAPWQSDSGGSDRKSGQPETEGETRIPAASGQLRLAGQRPPLESPDPSGVGAVKLERRTQPRHAVDTAAVIQLDRMDHGGRQGIDSGSRLPCRILDLSASGCRIRTDGHFPGGINSRVEIEFRRDRVSFRLAGVVEAIHGRLAAGIRFLDVNTARRSQLEQLMLEIAGQSDLLQAGRNPGRRNPDRRNPDRPEP
jgi:hypothetical protein